MAKKLLALSQIIFKDMSFWCHVDPQLSPHHTNIDVCLRRVSKFGLLRIFGLWLTPPNLKELVFWKEDFTPYIIASWITMIYVRGMLSHSCRCMNTNIFFPCSFLFLSCLEYPNDTCLLYVPHRNLWFYLWTYSMLCLYSWRNCFEYCMQCHMTFSIIVVTFLRTILIK